MQKRGILIVLFMSFFLFILVYATIPPPPPTPSSPDTGLDTLNLTNQNTCNDSVKNNDETDIDCGGNCLDCGIGKNCSVDADCQTNYCNASDKCATPRCSNNVTDGSETDIDCGGVCSGCDIGKNCIVNSDCDSNFCNASKCVEPKCDDGVKNGIETGVDCGGNCVACASKSVPSEKDKAGESNKKKDKEETTSSTDVTAKENIEYQGNSEKGSKESSEEIIEISGTKESDILLNLSILTNIFVIILVIFVLYNSIQIRKIKTRLRIMPVRKDPIVERLAPYIKENLRRGYSHHKIKLALLKNNWPLEKIDEAFKHIKKW